LRSPFRFTPSLLLSLAMHVLVFAFLLTNMAKTNISQPIMVNLLKNPNPKIIKAGVVDKRAIDQAFQRQALEEKLKQQAIIEQQQKIERLKAEAEQAKQAAELAKVQKAKMELAAKKAAQEKSQQDKINFEKKLQAQKQAELKKQDELKKQNLAKQAAGLKAQRDKLQAEHNAFIATELEKYKIEFRTAIEDNRIISSVFPKDIRCAVRIQLLPDGSILSVNVAEPSGNPAYDELQISAVYKAAPFPMPEDHELYNQLRDIVLSFRNGEQAADA